MSNGTDTSTPSTLDCGHVANASLEGIPAIGYDPATGQTVCDVCARALPPQPMTVHFLGDDNHPPYTRETLDTDKIPSPAGHTSRGLYFLAVDGTPTHASWYMLDGSVKYIHVSADVFGLHRMLGGHDAF